MAKSTLLKVVLLGDGGVGKSALMTRYVKNHFEQKSFHTIGVEFLNKDISTNGNSYTLQIWDTAGQERFKSLRTPFYRGADCCILVFAVNDKQSFANIDFWKKEFLYYADIRDINKFPFIVIGNKIDLDRDRTVSEEEAKCWCDNQSIPYYQTSAKTSENVNKAFFYALEVFMSSEENQKQIEKNQSVNLSKNKDKSECSC